MSVEETKILQIELKYLKAGQDSMKRDINELFTLVRSIQILLAERRGAVNLVNAALVVGSSTIAVVVSKLIG